MFGGGPELTHDAKEFLVRLEMHPDIVVLLGAFCQSESQSWRLDLQRLVAAPQISRFSIVIIARIPLRRASGVLKNPQQGNYLEDKNSMKCQTAFIK
jgi:hypothetical protein